MSDSDSKSRRKGRSLSKRKRETWQEVPALLKRAAAIQKLPNVNAALEEQRALLPTDFQISVPPYGNEGFPDCDSTILTRSSNLSSSSIHTRLHRLGQ